LNTKEFVNVVKKNFQVLPTRQEVKEFMWKNNLDINKSTDEITMILVNAYRGVNYRIPHKRKEQNFEKIKKEDIQKCLDLGMMHTEICNHLGISPCKLSKLKAEYGLLKKNRKLDDKEFSEFMKYHTQAEAAKHFHKDQSEICKRMKALGIQGKRNFMELWLQLKEKADNKTLKLMKELEG
jgi:hypothetical protein